MKIDTEYDTWHIQGVKIREKTNEAILYILKQPLKKWGRTRSTKLWVPMNKKRIKELIQELQEVEKQLEGEEE